MRKPVVLPNVEAALLAVASDSLALVTYTATEVFVSTCHGAGKFSRKDWDAAKAPPPSVVPRGGAA